MALITPAWPFWKSRTNRKQERAEKAEQRAEKTEKMGVETTKSPTEGPSKNEKCHGPKLGLG
jgi:hypothetical protein